MENCYKKEFGKLFTKKRQEQGLSQKELASILKVSRSVMTNIETGSGSSISLFKAFELADILKINTTELYRLYRKVKLTIQKKDLSENLRAGLEDLVGEKSEEFDK